MIRRFLVKFGEVMQRFMYGRYGIDQFGTFLLTAGMITAFLSLMRWFAWLGIISFFLIVWAYIRIFSKNFDKRRRELNFYLKSKYRIRERVDLIKRIFRERKTHRYLRCKLCKTRLRVPKGKGKIEITCPKCKNRMIKKT